MHSAVGGWADGGGCQLERATAKVPSNVCLLLPPLLLPLLLLLLLLPLPLIMLPLHMLFCSSCCCRSPPCWLQARGCTS